MCVMHHKFRNKTFISDDDDDEERCSFSPENKLNVEGGTTEKFSPKK